MHICILPVLFPLVAILLGVLQCNATAPTMAACPALPATEDAAAQWLAEGNAAYEAGDLAKAESRWTEIRDCAAGTADWPKAVSNLGLLESRRKNFPRAIAYYEAVLQSHPDDKEPGASLMETNRNYSFRSAMAISEAYEAMGAYVPALRYAWLAKTKYHYYSWCGTCLQSANIAVNKRIAYLTMRASRVHIWASVLLVAFVGFRKRKLTKDKRPPTGHPGVLHGKPGS